MRSETHTSDGFEAEITIHNTTPGGAAFGLAQGELVPEGGVYVPPSVSKAIGMEPGMTYLGLVIPNPKQVKNTPYAAISVSSVSGRQLERFNQDRVRVELDARVICTAQELAAELGLPMKHVGGFLHQMWTQGEVRRAPVFSEPRSNTEAILWISNDADLNALFDEG